MQTHSLWLAALALGLVLALIWLLQLALTRMRAPAALAAWLPRPPHAARLRVVERLSLDPRRRVLLLACDGREAWVLVGGPNDVLLGALPAPAESVP